jgi:hypothetical protein
VSSIAPVASSSRIDRGSADRLLFAKHEAPLRSSPSANVAFQQFVDAHRHLLVDWMARRMTFELVNSDLSGGDVFAICAASTPGG